MKESWKKIRGKAIAAASVIVIVLVVWGMLPNSRRRAVSPGGANSSIDAPGSAQPAMKPVQLIWIQVDKSELTGIFIPNGMKAKFAPIRPTCSVYYTEYYDRAEIGDIGPGVFTEVPYTPGDHQLGFMLDKKTSVASQVIGVYLYDARSEPQPDWFDQLTLHGQLVKG